jgi:hypothetical protein
MRQYYRWAATSLYTNASGVLARLKEPNLVAKKMSLRLFVDSNHFPSVASAIADNLSKPVGLMMLGVTHSCHRYQPCPRKSILYLRRRSMPS